MFGIPKLVLYGLAAVAVFSLVVTWIAMRERAAYIRGQDDLQVAVEKRNREAAQQAQEARNALDRCYDSDGTWDQSRGVCVTK
jgi:hypothetical protein